MLRLIRQLPIACIALLAATLAAANPVCVSTPPQGLSGGIGGTGHSNESAAPARGGVGGTGHSASGGIGGTGAIAAGGVGGTGAPAEGGVGGTGAIAAGGIGGTGATASSEGGVGGTGIVGTITGFASICVNGLEVHYDTTTKVLVNGREASLGEMAVGQVVALEAMPTERGLVARDIRMINALEGPITGLDHGLGRLQVMGRDVVLPPGLAKKLDGLAVGAMVQVSGLVNGGGHLVASRVSARPDLAQATVVGAAVEGKVQGIPVAAAMSNGVTIQEVQASGRWNGRELVAQQVQVAPLLPDRGRLANAVVEGYVQTDRLGRAHVAGFELTGARAGLAHDRPIVVSGRLVDGRLRVEKVEAAPRVVSDVAVGAGSRADGSTSSSTTSSTSTVQQEVDRVDDVETDDSVTIPRAPERSDSVDRGDRSDRSEYVDRPDKIDKPEKVERPEKVEKPEKVERPEKIEKPEKVERPEKVEKPEKVERPEKPEVEHH